MIIVMTAVVLIVVPGVPRHRRHFFRDHHVRALKVSQYRNDNDQENDAYDCKAEPHTAQLRDCRVTGLGRQEGHVFWSQRCRAHKGRRPEPLRHAPRAIPPVPGQHRLPFSPVHVIRVADVERLYPDNRNSNISIPSRKPTENDTCIDSSSQTCWGSQTALP